MKSLVVYDSMFGNTKKVSEAIAQTLKARAVMVSDFTPRLLKTASLLVVGCPIQGWRPSQPTLNFLSSLPQDSLAGKQVAAFDTRIKIFFSGSASDKINDALENLGGSPVIAPTNFIVKGKEGPLLDGELDRAKDWAKKILANLKK